MSSVKPLGCYQVLQSLMTVPPWGTVTAMGGCPEAWCCRWIQPHFSAGTQLPFRWSKPWKKNHRHTNCIKDWEIIFFLFLFLYSNIMCLWMCTASIEVFHKTCKAAPLQSKSTNKLNICSICSSCPRYKMDGWINDCMDGWMDGWKNDWLIYESTDVLHTLICTEKVFMFGFTVTLRDLCYFKRKIDTWAIERFTSGQ